MRTKLKISRSVLLRDHLWSSISSLCCIVLFINMSLMAMYLVSDSTFLSKELTRFFLVSAFLLGITDLLVYRWERSVSYEIGDDGFRCLVPWSTIMWNIGMTEKRTVLFWKEFTADRYTISKPWYSPFPVVYARMKYGYLKFVCFFPNWASIENKEDVERILEDHPQTVLTEFVKKSMTAEYK